MILLEFHNRVIQETLKTRCQTLAASGDTTKVKEIDVTIADFDGCLYHISNPEEGNTSVIQISIQLQYWHQLEQHDVNEFLKQEYGDYFTAPEANYNASIVVDLTTIASNPDATIEKFARLKRNAFAGVFAKYFRIQQGGGDGADGHPAVVNYRPQETMYVSAFRDRVTVVFSTLFTDNDDVVLGKVFLQEFKDGKKGNQSAPHVLFSHKDPPRELQEVPGALTGDNVGYVTFVLFPRHIEPKNADRTIDLIHQFRDYLHYHLKCSKAYLHTRMRARSADLLKILNRAKPENENKGRRTISGRSFVRK